MYSLTPTLSKEFILKHLSQEEIYEKYLGVSVVYDKKICSPLREDKNPTCGFKYVGNILYFRDFSGAFFGNCFDLVMHMHHCDFTGAMYTIAKDFGLITEEQQVKHIDFNAEFKPKIYIPPLKARALLNFVPRGYTKDDAEYWKRFEITRDTLDKFKVYPLQYLYKDSMLIYEYQVYDPAYLYWFKKDHYKIYFPYRSDSRFLGNTNVVQGLEQLPEEGTFLVVTKSQKDIMVLYEQSLPAVAWQGEGMIPPSDEIDSLRKRFPIIVSLYDFDLTGVRTANLLRKKDKVFPLFLTNGLLGSSNWGVKDTAEFVEKYGKTKLTELINLVKTNLEWEKLL